MFRNILTAGLLVVSSQLAVAGSSGFIDNMPQLSPDQDRAGAMIWQKPGLDRSAYTRLMMEPVTIFLSPDSEYKGISSSDLKALTDEFNNAILNTLEPDFPVVSKAGPGVLYLRAAITGVKLAKKKRGLLSFTPIGMVANAVKGDPDVSLKGAVLKIEMLDSVSGERLGVLVDKAPETGDMSWDAINKTFVFYAERFKERMQEAK